MNRTIGGIPILYWLAGIGATIGVALWIKKRGAKGTSPGTLGAGSTPAFTQAQEVQDFQIFSALTGAQQASDLNVVSEVAGLFAGGPSTSTTGSGTAPPSTGGVPPAVQSSYEGNVTKALGPTDAFYLLNQANQAAGYDYYTSKGLQTTPLGVAPGENP